MTSVLTLPSHMSGFLHELGPHSGVYSYVSKPTMIITNKPKFRNHITGKPPNIMVDRRVIRGNTYSPFKADIFSISKQKVSPTDGTFIRRRESSSSNNQHTLNKSRRKFPEIIERFPLPSPKIEHRHHPGFPGSPVRPPTRPYKLASVTNGPAPQRKHRNLQTEKWLEELSGRTPEVNAEVQTDPFTSPVVSPRLVEGRRGVDKETQIYPNDPEIFDFDTEVVGVLEGLLGRCMEQSILEVLHEEEAAILRRQKLDHKAELQVLQISV